jgi:hypothetical protein
MFKKKLKAKLHHNIDYICITCGAKIVPVLVLNRILRLDSLPPSTSLKAPRNHRRLRAKSISLCGRRTRSPCPRAKLCSSLTNQVGINHPFDHYLFSFSYSHTHTQLQGRTFQYLFIYVFHPCRSSRGQSSGKSSKMYLRVCIYI